MKKILVNIGDALPSVRLYHNFTGGVMESYHAPSTIALWPVASRSFVHFDALEGLKRLVGLETWEKVMIYDDDPLD